ncbi:MAG: hypothetical protein ABIT38_06840 [Gemmatimonadaceae bacterium]
MSHSHEPPNDRSAAFTGLIVTAVALFVLVFGIVTWTNSKYAGETGGEKAAQTSH